jgi:Uma2 family endonuclease
MALPVADIHRWSREEYERLVEIGVLGPEDKVELLDGIIYDMTPQDSWHASGVQAVNEALRSIFGEGYTIRVQMPLALGQSSEPEPDVAVVSGHWRDFRRSHPTAAVLVVEISGRSLFHDRERKQSLYALADIPESWILNLAERRLEVYRNPQDGIYQSRTILQQGDFISPLARPDVSIPVSELLP